MATLPKKKEVDPMDEMMARMKVKVVKRLEDDRRSLCGEPMQVRKTANGIEHYFIVPAHQLKYLQRIMPGYDFSKPFELKPTADKKTDDPEK